jgi:metal-responsive CopG/Arc/MetJ family transcriptional regulator
MVEDLDRVRQRDHRSRSDVVREALRQYVAHHEGTRRIPEVDPDSGEMEAVQRGRKAIVQGEYVTLDALLDEMGRRR